ncbi:hypothetical protein PN441_19020 [Spirulina major CS-329]|nr:MULTISPECIES: hypothetical protein [Spirulina]MDB9494108.1 hypothetical protein [Spirulina subsalsa CS-330]MDB9505177.1 hypothetical protein [Spirulina major CS-329]
MQNFRSDCCDLCDGFGECVGLWGRSLRCSVGVARAGVNRSGSTVITA